MSTVSLQEGVTSQTYAKLLELQPRCIVCGGTYNLHAHHRIFRSEGNSFLQKFLSVALAIYSSVYSKQILPWNLHDIQNLCVLCNECHEGSEGVHGGNEELRKYIRHSFTCPVTGFNIPYWKNTDKNW
jgi:5-methylcytosine-specific restriction endonuclease McrA